MIYDLPAMPKQTFLLLERVVKGVAETPSIYRPLLVSSNENRFTNPQARNHIKTKRPLGYSLKEPARSEYSIYLSPRFQPNSPGIYITLLHELAHVFGKMDHEALWRYVFEQSVEVFNEEYPSPYPTLTDDLVRVYTPNYIGDA